MSGAEEAGSLTELFRGLIMTVTPGNGEEVSMRLLSSSSLARTAAALSAGLLAAACSASTPPSPSGPPAAGAGSPQSASPEASATPVGLIALGHSALTGENSDPNNPHAAALENSWATGTNPKVDSIYQRMVAQWPDTLDHVFNAAVGGATASTLNEQAQTALSAVPTPRLVIIQTVDNDLNCPIEDSAFTDFGTAVDNALHTITQASPRGRIFVVLYGGRPADQFQSDLNAANGDPTILNQMTGPPPCGILDKNHKVQPESARYLAVEVDKFNAQLVQVCAKYPTCVTDKGSEYAFKLPPHGTNRFNDHLSVVGLAAVATFFWPLVRATLVKS